MQLLNQYGYFFPDRGEGMEIHAFRPALRGPSINARGSSMRTKTQQARPKPPDLPVPQIPLTADPVFKYVFGSPGSEEVLAFLLNAILADDVDQPFEDITFIPQEPTPSSSGARTCRLDIVATDRAGRVVDVEMQRYGDDRYAERLTFYISRLVTDYTPKGKELKLCRVMCLSIGEHPLPGLEDCPAPVVRMRTTVDQEGYEVKGGLPLTVHVNLSQVRQRFKGKDAEDFDGWEKWCYYLAMEGGEMATDEELEKIRDIMAADPAIREADKRYRESLAGDDEALRMGLLRDWYHAMKEAGELATARVHGESEGLKKGKLETAKAMKVDGMPAETICRYTGLTEQQIENL